MPPKGKGKGAKEKGKDKNSPKKTTPGEPTESEMQTEWMNCCLFCARTFNNPAIIQSHLLTSDHFGNDAPLVQQCRVCCSYTSMPELEYHECTTHKMVFLDQILSSTSIKKGMPLVCLICRARPLMSKLELIVHLMCLHAPHKQKGYCGLCNYTYQEPDCIELLEEPWKDEALDQHVKTEHEFRYAMLVSKNINADSELRFPYTCPLCSFYMVDNAQFHAHILCRHATRHRCDEDLYTCLECVVPRGDGMALNRHINNEHCQRFRKLATKWDNDGLMQKFIDFMHVCCTCWTYFEFDWELQAHIIMNHTVTPHEFMICGWCKSDFRTFSKNVTTVWRNYQFHERQHCRMAHTIALEFQCTEIPLGEEEPDPELLDQAEEMNKVLPLKEKGKGKGKDKGKGGKGGKGKVKK